MKEIKRLDATDILEKFGLEAESEQFIFKSQEITPQRQHEPHRSKMYSLGLVVKGEAQLRMDLELYHVQAPGLVAVGSDQVRQWMVQDEHIQFMSLFFTEDFVVSGLSDASFLNRFPFFKRTGNHFIPLNHAQFTSLKDLFTQIEHKKNANNFNKGKIIQALLRALLLEGEGLEQIQIKKDPATITQAHRLTESFKQLLTENFIQQREVNFYADQLSVTPKHLSQTIKEQTGKTAGQLINEVVSLEAKVLLQRNALTISEISEGLNFANPSFFGKFFKRNTSMSPMQYRKTLS